MPTVFIVQDQKWVDPKTGQLKGKFDFTPAESFGKLEYLLKPSASPFDLPPVIRALKDRLLGIRPDDYLLLTGNPALIGLAVAIAADYLDGNLKMLQWSGAKRQYIPIFAEDVFPDLPA